MMLVNRKEERSIIEQALDDLKSRERLVQTPILNLYGTSGIGKSRLLVDTIEKCVEKELSCIAAIAERDSTELHFQKENPPHNIILKDTLEKAIREADTTTDYLVLIIDDVETANDAQMQQLKDFLRKKSAVNNLFILLASRRKILFEDEKKIMRKLTTYPIPPLDTSQFLAEQPDALSEEQRKLINTWTRGHPVAMLEMVQAFTKGFDQTSQWESEQLIQQVVNKVIRQGLLASVEEHKKERFQALLLLLAVPRRFNLALMRRLIEKFEERYCEPKSLLYANIPREITKATGVIDWNVVKAGFHIEEPIRTILLTYLEISHKSRYQEIHAHLTQSNWDYALAVQDDDRIRYLLEFLYHSATGSGPEAMAHILQETVTKIITDAELSTEQLESFLKEFSNDTSLLETLGQHTLMLKITIHTHLATHFYQLQEQEKDMERRTRLVEASFVYLSLLPEQDQARKTSLEYFQKLLADVNPHWLHALFKTLSHNKEFVAMMGNEYTSVEEKIVEATWTEE